MEAEYGYKAYPQAKVDPFEDWIKKNRGKLVLIYGEPLSGKTTFAIQVAKRFKAPLYIAIDENIKDVGDIHMQKMDYRTLLNRISEIARMPRETTNADVIVIDSITTVASDFYENSKLVSTRKNLEMRRFYDKLFRLLSKIASKGVTVIAVAHESIKSFGTAQHGEERGPAVNKIALRHVDAVYHAIHEGDKYAIVLENRRRYVENPTFKIVEG